MFASKHLLCHRYDDYWSSKLDTNRESDLLTLLERFGNQQCADPRDRVFSLLSLCSTGGRIVPVDYNIPLDELAIRILVQDPDRLCICSIAIVLSVVSSRSVPWAYIDTGPWFEIELPNGFATRGYICLDSVRECICPYVCPPPDIGLERSGIWRLKIRPDGMTALRVSSQWIVDQNRDRSLLCSSAKKSSKRWPPGRFIRLGRGNAQDFPVENAGSQDSMS